MEFFSPVEPGMIQKALRPAAHGRVGGSSLLPSFCLPIRLRAGACQSVYITFAMESEVRPDTCTSKWRDE